VESRRLHSRYVRRLADTGGGQEGLIRLQVRRFFCGNTWCTKQTFAEQAAALTARHARRTTALSAVLQAVALALGRRAGSRLAAEASRSTLLRLILMSVDTLARSPTA
jgi:hypothetical protein